MPSEEQKKQNPIERLVGLFWEVSRSGLVAVFRGSCRHNGNFVNRRSIDYKVMIAA